MTKTRRGLLASGAGLALVAGALAGVASSGSSAAEDAPSVAQLQALNQTKGYLQAHKGVQKPGGLFGGPIRVRLTQSTGGVFVGLPDRRKLDPDLFGPETMPRHYAGTPVVTGVPPKIRVDAPDGGEQTKPLTPFGQKHAVLPGAQLSVSALDATATDAATTSDRVNLVASWQDKQGNTYEVRCCAKLAAHGVEHPTFGGVVTNTILHGFTGIGTPLMPSEYTYFAFWGIGEVKKNGEVLDKPRLVHGMLTEYVRKQGYALGFDEDVTPSRLHFHLITPPVNPVPEKGVFEKSPVKTGFTLPNGKELPFWHVMFENVDIQASRA